MIKLKKNLKLISKYLIKLIRLKKIIRLIFKYLIKFNSIKFFFKELSSELAIYSVYKNDIIEITPLNPTKSKFEDHRLNILIPGLSIQHIFGGISTALNFFETLGKDYKNKRIIITDEVNYVSGDNQNYKSWKITNSNIDESGSTICVLGDRGDKFLTVGKNDIFIATAWWTHNLVKNIQEFQKSTFQLNSIKKFIYLIQDFEPGFYSWSSRYALAESTYHNSDDYIAIFNSTFLKNYFDKEQYKFSKFYVFEPYLHPVLKSNLSLLKKNRKKNRILIYGRPGTDRNAFQMIVMSLKLWVSENQNTNWEFFSAGEFHQDIDLGYNKKINCLGKMSLDEYSRQLSLASVGISLMISPHPSYPPLEMAAYGVKVITNKYKGKNLSELNPNILTPEILNIASLVELISHAIQSCDTISNISELTLNSEIWNRYLNSGNDFENICEDIKIYFNDNT